MADEYQFSERLQDILKGIDQDELNGAFQDCMRGFKNSAKAMEITPDDK
jgi:hypothetical protein